MTKSSRLIVTDLGRLTLLKTNISPLAVKRNMKNQKSSSVDHEQSLLLHQCLKRYQKKKVMVLEVILIAFGLPRSRERRRKIENRYLKAFDLFTCQQDHPYHVIIIISIIFKFESFFIFITATLKILLLKRLSVIDVSGFTTWSKTTKLLNKFVKSESKMTSMRFND